MTVPDYTTHPDPENESFSHRGNASDCFECELHKYRTAYEQLVNQVEWFLNRPDVIEHVPIMMLADLDQIVTESQIDLQHVLNPEEQNDNPADPDVPPAPSAPALPRDSGQSEAD